MDHIVWLEAAWTATAATATISDRHFELSLSLLRRRVQALCWCCWNCWCWWWNNGREKSVNGKWKKRRGGRCCSKSSDWNTGEGKDGTRNRWDVALSQAAPQSVSEWMRQYQSDLKVVAMVVVVNVRVFDWNGVCVIERKRRQSE